MISRSRVLLEQVDSLCAAFVLAILVLSPCGLPANEPAETRHARLDFVRDVEPLLAEKCYRCHGAEKQEGQLRLDAKITVLRGGVSGSLLEPGNSAASLLYQVVAGLSELERMPLEDEPLSVEQINVIRRWIDEGAVWPDGVGANIALGEHWAYVPVSRPQLPEVHNASWIRSPIDAFVLKRLEQERLAPAPRAEDAELLRRVYLDLIGLPPDLDAVEAFIASNAPDKYARVVEELLASPQYGARWARPWLDAARYADTNGYQADQYRSVWPYRDWVIQAMNADLPFDQFTREQLAGDLLLEATIEQKIATGFHRLTTCNVEAGVDPEENRVNQIIDRVNTTGTVWLGTSLECAQCHNHKYDPFTQRDYYQLFAYFNNTPLEVQGDGVTYEFVGPQMELPRRADQQQEWEQLQRRRDELRPVLRQLVDERLREFSSWEQRIAGTNEDGGKSNADTQHSEVPAAIAKILAIPVKQRNAKQKQALETYFTGLDPHIAHLREELAQVDQRLAVLPPRTTLVMIEEQKARATNIFKRGNFLEPGEPVAMKTPEALTGLKSKSTEDRVSEEIDTKNIAAGDRRELAEWIASRDNPLTARVAVNRWWAEFFGRGIVETLEDFGQQGERPTHPELLDWLATELMDSGWSMKHVHRQIVLSAMYQQSSRVTEALLQRDPGNKFYARAPRFRLPAETLRDNALTIAGLLSHELAGPPIYPPQPPNFWRHVGRNEPKYETSQGGARFRRGIYVIWRRSAPYPSFTTFDAPDRAACVVQRSRTNTPLQALTLLNDPAYMEMAIALAERIASAPAALTIEERVEYGLRLCVARIPKSAEVQQLAKAYRIELEHFSKSPQAARALIGSRANSTTDLGELAAWTCVANILLNLDETITKG